jgi:hypothetical protein
MNPRTARLAVCTRGRGPDYMGWPTGSDPDIETLAAAVANSPAELHWLSGAESTLRADLPQLIRTLSETPIGLDTDGLALVSDSVIGVLMQAGLSRVRIGLHSSHSDAHDWLVGLPGAAKRARRALRTCLKASLEVDAQIILSRPTTEHLPETVALLRHLGVSRIHIRRPVLLDALHDRAIALSPRLSLLEPWLEACLQEAGDMELLVHDIPPCVAPGLPIKHFESEPWVLTAGLQLQASHGAGCTNCPQNFRCAGGPADYTALFGRLELDSAGPLPRDSICVPSTLPEGATPPPVRAGRSPATRIRQVHRQLALGRLYGDPVNGQDPAESPQQICVRLQGSSREIRKALVRAAQEGAPELVVEAVGLEPHPDLAELLMDSGRLSFERIILRAPEAHIASLGDKKRVALRRISQVEAIDPALPAEHR